MSRKLVQADINFIASLIAHEFFFKKKKKKSSLFRLIVSSKQLRNKY